jgi:hypothetical protein
MALTVPITATSATAHNPAKGCRRWFALSQPSASGITANNTAIALSR